MIEWQIDSVTDGPDSREDLASKNEWGYVTFVGQGTVKSVLLNVSKFHDIVFIQPKIVLPLTVVEECNYNT